MIYYDENLVQEYLKDNIDQINDINISESDVNIEFINGDKINVYFDLSGITLLKENESIKTNCKIILKLNESIDLELLQSLFRQIEQFNPKLDVLESTIEINIDRKKEISVVNKIKSFEYQIKKHLYKNIIEKIEIKELIK